MAIECLCLHYVLSLESIKFATVDTLELEQLRHFAGAHPVRSRWDPVVYVGQDVCRRASDGQLGGNSQLVVVLQRCHKATNLAVLWWGLQQPGQRAKMRHHCHKIKWGLLLLAVLISPPRLVSRTGAGITLPSARRSRTSPGRIPGWWTGMSRPPGCPLVRLPQRKSHPRQPHTPGAGSRDGWTAPIH